MKRHPGRFRHTFLFPISPIPFSGPWACWYGVTCRTRHAVVFRGVVLEKQAWGSSLDLLFIILNRILSLKCNIFPVEIKTQKRYSKWVFFPLKSAPFLVELFHLLEILYMLCNSIIMTITKTPNKAVFTFHIYSRPCPHADIIFIVLLIVYK